jgi:signal transduction histidine kinase
MFIIPPIGRLIRRDVLLIQVIPTLVVFLVLLTFALISWRSAEATLRVQKEQKISEEMNSLEDAIKLKIDNKETLLRSGVGFFDGSEVVSRDEWNRFYSKFNVKERFSGVSTLGYAPVVRNSEVGAFENTLRTEGVGATTITPSSSNEMHVPVMYSQAYREGTNPVGFDMYSEPSRRKALDAAAASGNVAMTNRIDLYSSNDSDKKVPGIILYMPVYVRDVPTNSADERKNALRGFVYISLVADQLFADIALSNNFNFTVTNVSDDNPQLLFSSAEDKKQPVNTVRESHLDTFSQSWEIVLSADGDIVSNTDSQRPSTVAAAGVAISLIASVAVYLLVQFRTRTFALSEERKLQQAKDELLSLASHQLRTPATGVKQYVGMVLDGFGGRLLKGQTKLLEQAYKSNERQLQIINEFLYVAKLGSGSLRTTSRTFDIVPVLRDVVEEMSYDLDEKNHTLKVITPKTAVVYADEHSIRMILENLLSNAIKYTPDHGSIRIKVQKVDAQMKVSVKDNGIGIAKRDMQLLFKQFSRIPNKLSVDVSGSGIGLYLSQQLAERNQGTIVVDSKEGEGSTFTLSLPRKSVINLTKRLIR